MAEEVVYQNHAYRCVGGEIHRRSLLAGDLTPWEASWLVLNHGEEIPTEVKEKLAAPSGPLRFD